MQQCPLCQCNASTSNSASASSAAALTSLVNTAALQIGPNGQNSTDASQRRIPMRTNDAELLAAEYALQQKWGFITIVTTDDREGNYVYDIQHLFVIV